MRSLALGLAFFVCSTSSSALGAPRQIRLSIDDTATGPLTHPPPSHGAFPLAEAAPTSPGRLIRLSLDDADPVYGHLRHLVALGRRIRTTLD